MNFTAGDFIKNTLSIVTGIANRQCLSHGFRNTIKAIDGRLSGLEIMVAEIRVTNRILIALLIAVLIKSFF